MSKGKTCRRSSDVGCVLKGAIEPLVKIWGITSGVREERVVAIHKNYQENATETIVTVQSLYPCRTGKLERLQLANGKTNFSALYGLEFAGQTWDGSKTGDLVGLRKAESVSCKGNGVYEFKILPGTAALLRIS